MAPLSLTRQAPLIKLRLKERKVYKHLSFSGTKREWMDLCDYAAPTSSDLGLHKKSKHEGIRYSCDQCEYTASKSSNLRAHKKAKHEGIRYPCDQCEYAATTSSNLRAHKKAKHEGIRYPCDKY